MILPVAAQWFAFLLFSLLAVLGGLGMATTMSMFRSGIFLMASFIGVAGLFILLSADLLGLLQVMMYIGGMLVMVMFMVLFMSDPGGSMMAGMHMSPIERLFSRGLKPQDPAAPETAPAGHSEGDHPGPPQAALHPHHAALDTPAILEPQHEGHPHGHQTLADTPAAAHSAHAHRISPDVQEPRPLTDHPHQTTPAMEDAAASQAHHHEQPEAPVDLPAHPGGDHAAHAGTVPLPHGHAEMDHHMHRSAAPVPEAHDHHLAEAGSSLPPVPGHVPMGQGEHTMHGPNPGGKMPAGRMSHSAMGHAMAQGAVGPQASVPMKHGGHDMHGMDMAMTTPVRPWGVGLGLVVAVGLVLMIVLRPAWPTGLAGPLDPDAPRQIGTLLMDKYMIGFEGAGLLILLGIMGAAFVQRAGHHGSDASRSAFVTAEEPPVPIAELHPLPEDAR